jgi:Cu-processing system ATP-binding protein
MQDLILTQVAKSFAGLSVLQQINLTVKAGERVALLGHNGAGKSTLMKLILGLLPVDAGRIEVLGATPGSPAARSLCAYLPENVAFHSSLTGLEQIELFLKLRGEPAREAPVLLESVGLGEAAKRRIGSYSKGMRQRVGLAQALIGKPKLLILDEPTSGLDPVSRRDFYEILDRLSADGSAILLSSHALTELEARTDRIVILSKGRLVADDTLAGLRRQAALPTRIQIAARSGMANEVARKLSAGRRNGAMVDLLCSPENKLSRLSDIAELREMIDDLEVMPPSLDDIYNHFSRKGE